MQDTIFFSNSPNVFTYGFETARENSPCSMQVVYKSMDKKMEYYDRICENNSLTQHYHTSH